MKIIDLLNKIANGELENETMISCNGFFHNIIYRDKNLYWVHRNEIVETKYITEAIQDNYEFKIYTEVEIIEYKEEKEEKKIPEKLNYQYRNLYGRLSQHKQSEIDIIDTLNGVIDYLKIKEKK